MTILAVIAALALTITSAVFFAAVINDSASDMLVVLKSDATNTQTELDALISRIPSIQQCGDDIVNRTLALQNCSAVAMQGLFLNSATITNITTALDVNNVNTLNTTMTNSITALCNRVTLLQSSILNAAANQTHVVPYVLQSGTANVWVTGGNMFNTTYSLNQVVIDDLKMVYMMLPKWTASLGITNSSINPVVQYNNFVPALTQKSTSAFANIHKQLIVTQSEKLQWSRSDDVKPSSYLWTDALQTLDIHNIGTTVPLDSLALINDLKIIFQFM